jgi:signal transduction histidine kinase/AraC-like DNA-binding protein/CheY-like chemotaxis protein/ABC-type xylose transport system substrate-binding protein
MSEEASGLRNLFFFLCLIVLAISLNGCKNEQKKSAYTIGFSQCVGSDLWRRTMLDEMKTELSLHPGARFVYADAENSSKKQIEQVKQMLKDGIDLLIISPNEAQPLTPVVEDAYDKGIPVIVTDRKTSSPQYTAFVGGNNYQLGKMAGEYLGAISKGNVNVLEIMGLPGSSPAIERDRGFSDGIKKFANVHITSRLYGDWLKENAENQLFKNKNGLAGVDFIFAHNDNMASGARQVLNKLKLNKKVKIIGVDALPGKDGGLQMVEHGIINASLLYPTGGKEAIVTAFHILNKEPFLRDNILQSVVIDSTNVQLMELQWNKINSQQGDIIKQQGLLAEQQSIYRGQQIVINIMVITLVLAIIFGGLAFYSLAENRKINKSLEAKNNEILLQRNQLIEMSAKAEAAAEARLNFFTNVSHEFRTPLTLMLSPLQDMLANEKLTAIAGRSVKMIHQNANRLLKLVNQLIDYRKLEFDKQNIKASENNIVDFIRDIMECFRFYAQKLNIQLSLVPQDAEIKVWFDPDMLDKVFFNLISNAIKFCTTEGRIKITIYQDEQYVNVEVEDNGRGMSDEDSALVFNQFYQADNAPVTGSGIGLSLSKEIILFHHGQIDVKSQKWKGTTFIVSLPLGDSHLDLQKKSYSHGNWPDIADRAKIYQADVDKIYGGKELDTVIKQKEHSILIVEDNADLLQYLAEKLSDHFEIFVADNGNTAITQANQFIPDLIISDVVMPGLSGKELSQKLKSDIRTSHIPIILLTAQGSAENQISGMRSMSDLYITKPFDFGYLLASIQSLIKNRSLLKEHFISDISLPDKTPVSKNIDKKFLNDFSAIVEGNLANDKFSVDDISRLIGISRVQLYRKVKALLDCTVTDYIMNRRLKKAKYLLNNETYTIAEITYMIGFSNPNYFATVFKAHYGCTPSEFKKNKINTL